MKLPTKLNRQKHDCPYLDNSGRPWKCTHERPENKGKKALAQCGFLDPFLCSIFNESMSKLKEDALKAKRLKIERLKRLRGLPELEAEHTK